MQGFQGFPRDCSPKDCVSDVCDSDASLGATKLVQNLQLTDKAEGVKQLFARTHRSSHTKSVTKKWRDYEGRAGPCSPFTNDNKKPFSLSSRARDSSPDRETLHLSPVPDGDNDLGQDGSHEAEGHAWSTQTSQSLGHSGRQV